MMENFKKYYKLPLKAYDHDLNYIWTDDTEMALNYLDDDLKIDTDSEFKKAINDRDNLVRMINGGIPGKFKDVEIDKHDPGVIIIEGVPRLMIRGWGMLTSQNHFNLSNNQAADIQDQFRDYIIDQLREKV